MDDRKEFYDSFQMDALREKIRKAVESNRTNYKALSRAIGRNDAYVQQFVKKGSPRELKDRDIRIIAAMIGEDAPKLVQSFDPDEPDTYEEFTPTMGTETGVRGIPEDASAQLDLTGGLGSGGLSIVSEGVPGRRGMTFAADQIRDYWRLPQAILGALGLRAHDVAIIPVQGDSMLPTLNEGDVVFIDTRHRWPSPPGLYAILDEIGGVVVKRLEISSPPGAEQQMVSIISDNPRHIRKEWRAEDVHIIGRVMRKFGVVA